MGKKLRNGAGLLAALAIAGICATPSARAEGEEGDRPGLGDSKERVRGVGTTRGTKRTTRGIRTQDFRNKERARVLRQKQQELRRVGLEGHRLSRELERAKKRGVFENGSPKEIERARFLEKRVAAIKERMDELSKQTDGTVKIRPIEDSLRGQRKDIRKAKVRGERILETHKERRDDLRDRLRDNRQRERDRKELLEKVRRGGKMIREDMLEKTEKATVD